LPDDLAAALKRETHGEVVRWHGRPNPTRSFLMTTPIWLFAVPWTAFSGFMMFGIAGALVFAKVPASAVGKIDAFVPSMGWIGVVFLVPFVMIGLGMMGLPFWVWRVSRTTVYAITDRRLLTIVAGPTTKVTSTDLSQIQSTERTERRDGSGTLKLITGRGRDSDGDTFEKTHTLFAIPDVKTVDTLVDGLRTARHR
jgi:hypothetical protein